LSRRSGDLPKEGDKRLAENVYVVYAFIKPQQVRSLDCAERSTESAESAESVESAEPAECSTKPAEPTKFKTESTKPAECSAESPESAKFAKPAECSTEPVESTRPAECSANSPESTDRIESTEPAGGSTESTDPAEYTSEPAEFSTESAEPAECYTKSAESAESAECSVKSAEPTEPAGCSTGSAEPAVCSTESTESTESVKSVEPAEGSTESAELTTPARAVDQNATVVPQKPDHQRTRSLVQALSEIHDHVRPEMHRAQLRYQNWKTRRPSARQHHQRHSPRNTNPAILVSSPRSNHPPTPPLRVVRKCFSPRLSIGTSRLHAGSHRLSRRLARTSRPRSPPRSKKTAPTRFQNVSTHPVARTVSLQARTRQLALHRSSAIKGGYCHGAGLDAPHRSEGFVEEGFVQKVLFRRFC
jgi:hypothetical protein